MLDGTGVDHLQVGEVGDKRRKEHRKGCDERGEPLAQGHAAKDAGFLALHLKAGAGVRAVDKGGRLGAQQRYAADAALGRAGHKLCLAARALVASAQEQAHDDEAREKRAAALAHEGKRHAREGQKLGDAGNDEERLEADDRGETHRGKGGRVGLGACRGGKAAHAEEHVEDDDGAGAQKAHFLGDGREEEVTLDKGDEGGHALANAAAHQVAVGDGVQRLHDLIAAVLGISPGVKPDVHADLHVREEVVAEEEANDEKANGNEHVAPPTGGNVEHDHEVHEEEKRAAQVALEDDDEQADAPHDEEGEQHAEARNAERPHAVRGDGERLSVGGKVEGQEENNENLGQLARLEREAAKREPELAAVLLGTNDHGQDEQDHAHKPQRVFVVRQLIEVTYKEERRNHGCN